MSRNAKVSAKRVSSAMSDGAIAIEPGFIGMVSPADILAIPRSVDAAWNPDPKRRWNYGRDDKESWGNPSAELAYSFASEGWNEALGLCQGYPIDATYKGEDVLPFPRAELRKRVVECRNAILDFVRDPRTAPPAYPLPDGAGGVKTIAPPDSQFAVNALRKVYWDDDDNVRMPRVIIFSGHRSEEACRWAIPWAVSMGRLVDPMGFKFGLKVVEFQGHARRLDVQMAENQGTRKRNLSDMGLLLQAMRLIREGYDPSALARQLGLDPNSTTDRGRSQKLHATAFLDSILPTARVIERIRNADGKFEGEPTKPGDKWTYRGKDGAIPWQKMDTQAIRMLAGLPREKGPQKGQFIKPELATQLGLKDPHKVASPEQFEKYIELAIRGKIKEPEMASKSAIEGWVKQFAAYPTYALPVHEVLSYVLDTKDGAKEFRIRLESLESAAKSAETVKGETVKGSKRGKREPVAV